MQYVKIITLIIKNIENKTFNVKSIICFGLSNTVPQLTLSKLEKIGINKFMHVIFLKFFFINIQ